MASRVAEPIVLASYNLTQRSASTSSRTRHVHAHVASADGELVTIAVQGDGVHIFDTSSMHSVASYALGPSANFSCPAQSRQLNAGSRTTYAALGSSDAQTELISWSGNLADKQEGTSQQKHSRTVSHAIHSIHTRKSQSTPLLAITRKGQVLLTDSDLKVVKTSATNAKVGDVRQAFVFDAHACGFLPTSSKMRNGTAVIVFLEDEDVLSAQLLTVDNDDDVSEPQDCGIALNSKDISALSCDASGHISILTSSGTWQLYLLAADGTSLKCIQQPKTVRLSPRLSMTGASILALGSSHVLLAATTKDDKPELVTLLWDLRYSAVIGHFSRSVPTLGTASSDHAVALELVAGKSSQVVLVVSPSITPPRGKGKAKASSSATVRSTVFLVPCNVPARSSIASALGHAEETAPWLAPEPATPAPDPTDVWAVLDAKREEMLNALEVAMTQASKEAIEKIFFDWAAQETATLKRRQETRNKSDAVSSSDPTTVKLNGTTAPHEADSDPERTTSSVPQRSGVLAMHLRLSHKLVTRVLGIILGPMENVRARPYPWQITKSLLDRGVVSDSMVKGGFIAALYARGDWVHIVLALKENRVPDVPETVLIRIMKDIIARKDTSTGEAMDVDSSGSGHNHGKMLLLPAFLSLCMSYPTSAPALRAAIREHLTSVEEVSAVLKALNAAVGNWSAIDDIARVQLQSEGAKNNKQRVPVDLGVHYSQAMAFLQTLIDATFLMLVQNPPLQKLLKKFQDHITPELELCVRIETLRGPLEQFLRHIARQKEEEKRKEQEAARGRGANARATPRERTGYQHLAGPYQVEQLTIWH
ncbi:hypothetical protein EXIGLDRAFT_690793 [Exidia glandulosa HHB12029]|uniref:Uncharacterized protein n=1 Tax=Exidia glandulosa HHB12029 TaxID=1314781 RepID=A0A165QW82_EXIGL|nr:hypothetical protein EXIGLDRAFT_690793 [Exidia glandulosa HHB12029]